MASSDVAKRSGHRHSAKHSRQSEGVTPRWLRERRRTACEDHAPYRDTDSLECASVVDQRQLACRVAQSDVHCLRPPKVLSQRFVVLLLVSYRISRLTWCERRDWFAIGQQRFEGSHREIIAFRFHPLPEQQRIVGILDEAFEGIATAKANAEKNLQNARALFESHLQSVFTERGSWVG